MLDMLKCLDAFAGQQSRLVVVVDGLDSCEQPKVGPFQEGGRGICCQEINLVLFRSFLYWTQ